jgi:hypothetical protein
MNECLNKVGGCVEFEWWFSPLTVALKDEAEHETKSAAEVEMVLTENLTGTCDDKPARSADVFSREHGRAVVELRPVNKQTNCSSIDRR